MEVDQSKQMGVSYMLSDEIFLNGSENNKNDNFTEWLLPLVNILHLEFIR